MKQSFFNEASLIWTAISGVKKTNDLNFELEIHKRLLNIFHIGPYYYYVFNVNNPCFEFMSPLIKEVLGYESDDVEVHSFINNIHPDDQPWFLNFENKVCDFFKGLTIDQIPNYKVSYDYRIKKQNGEYIRILQQVLVIDYDTNGNILRTLGVHTDISSLKPTFDTGIKSKLSFIGLNGQPSYYDVDVKEVFKTSNSQVTKRERDILCLLLDGKNSLEIAKLLIISKFTVDTHRKNLLNKMKVNNTAELVSKSIKMGWV